MEIGRSSNTCIYCQDALLIRDTIRWVNALTLHEFPYSQLSLYFSTFFPQTFALGSNQLLMLVVVVVVDTSLVGH